MHRGNLARCLSAVALASVLSSCGAAIAGSQTSTVGKSKITGTVTMANPPATNFETILPIFPTTTSNGTSQLTIRLLYLPLYQYYSPNSSASFDPTLSLAYAPTYANGGRTVNIRLKPFSWSNGSPVTARDVEFWENLLVSNKATWAEYVPGDYPDDVTSFKVTGERSFSMTFNAAYNHAWLLRNNLAWITPMPQASWGRTSADQAIGNYDETPSGAKAVFAYLADQAQKLATYATNPLWKVVDGPYRISAYSATTGYTVLVPNHQYSGTDKPKTARFEELPYTSAAAEFDALRSGDVDYGYLPVEDVSQAAYFEKRGYRIAPWYGGEVNFIVLNYANAQVGPIFRQLYIRRALQELVDETAYVKDILHGYGHTSYGPVPSFPANGEEGSGEVHPVYTYKPAQATALLGSHGWKKNGSGVLTCVRPGTKGTQCGAGITRGEALSLSLIYTSGTTSGTDEVEALKSEWGTKGIELSLSSLPFDSIFGKLAPGASSWELGWWGGSDYAWNYEFNLPIPAQLLASGGSFNLGEYKSSTMDADILAAEMGQGPVGLEDVGSYGAEDVSDIWMPIQPNQISVVRSDLKGALPQSADAAWQPELWSLG